MAKVVHSLAPVLAIAVPGAAILALGAAALAGLAMSPPHAILPTPGGGADVAATAAGLAVAG
ncbi:MAG: hypothetical protein ABI789_15245, partial [Usitatibacter sp.]